MTITPFYVEKFEDPKLSEEYKEIIDSLPESDDWDYPEYDDVSLNF